MTCREFIDFLDDYLTGGLTADQRAAFDRHLAVCVDCRNYLESYKQTVRLGKAAFPPQQREVPDNVPEGLVKAVLAATVGTRSRRE